MGVLAGTVMRRVCCIPPFAELLVSLDDPCVIRRRLPSRVLSTPSCRCGVVEHGPRRMNRLASPAGRALLDSWLMVFGLDAALAFPWSDWLMAQDKLDRGFLHRLANWRRTALRASDDAERLAALAPDDRARELTRRQELLGLVPSMGRPFCRVPNTTVGESAISEGDTCSDD